MSIGLLRRLTVITHLQHSDLHSRFLSNASILTTTDFSMLFIKLETKRTKAGGKSESLAGPGGDLQDCTGVSYQP